MNKNGEIRVRTAIAEPTSNTWVPQWLQEHIRTRAKTHGDFIFGSHATMDLDVITEGWRRRLQEFWRFAALGRSSQSASFAHYAEFRTMPSKFLLMQQRPGMTGLPERDSFFGLGIVPGDGYRL